MKMDLFWQGLRGMGIGIAAIILLANQVFSQPQTEAVSCDILVVGGGVSGVATAYEALKSGRTVCLTDITDWLGGQVSAQGISALDEELSKSTQQIFPQGYLELRQRINNVYGTQNPGRCWVSAVCFLPRDGHRIILAMLQEAAMTGGGTLRWFPKTVIKDLQTVSLQSNPTEPLEQMIQSVQGIQHDVAPGAPPLDTYPLSQTIEESYREQDSKLFKKRNIRFHPPASGRWYVIEATETGEIMALADIPYRVGIDPRSYRNPSSSSGVADPYCIQGFTYSFAIEATVTPQEHRMPAFYPQYASYYSYGVPQYANLPDVFTYRRIWSANRRTPLRTVSPGDISLQNWEWGNDYRPGTERDNLVYTQQQLRQSGQLEPGGWQGGLRVKTLRSAEQLAEGFFYWLTAGTTDSQLGAGVKRPDPRLHYLQGLQSTMGTVHGLSKYPYIREGRRSIGRVSTAYPQGFSIDEIDISQQNYEQAYYRQKLPPRMYQALRAELARLGESGMQRTQATVFPDSVGIGHYAIDIHGCLTLSPPERVGNYERPGEKQARVQTYPFQIPLRAMIPQQINNLLVTGKNMATSHISAAAYRTQPIEWSIGAAAGVTANFALERGIWANQLVETLPHENAQLLALQQRLRDRGNPIAFSVSPMEWRWKWRFVIFAVAIVGILLVLFRRLCCKYIE